MSSQQSPASEKSWYEHLILPGISLGKKDELHSDGFVERKRASCSNKPLTATRFLFGDESTGWIVNHIKDLRHSNILQFRGVINSPERDHLYLVTEVMIENLTELLKRLPKWSLKDRISGIHQIAAALSYLHSKKIPHGNLKPENVYSFKDGQILKVAYFGLKEFSLTKGATDADDVKAFGSLVRILICGSNEPAEFEKALKMADKQTFNMLTKMLEKCENENPPPISELIDNFPSSSNMGGVAKAQGVEEKDTGKTEASKRTEQISKSDEVNEQRVKDEDKAEAKSLRATSEDKEKNLQSQLASLKAEYEQAKKDHSKEIKQLREKHKKLEDEKTKLSQKCDEKENLVASFRAARDKADKDHCEKIKQLTDKHEADRRSKEHNYKQLLVEKTNLSQTCAEMEKVVENMKARVASQEQTLTETTNELRGTKAVLNEKEAVLREKTWKLEETEKALGKASDYITRIRSSADDMLPQLKVPDGPPQPIGPQETGNKEGESVSGNGAVTYACRRCTTQLLGMSSVLHVQRQETKSIVILGDYNKVSQTIKDLLDVSMKQYRKKIPITLVTRGDLKKSRGALITPDATCIIVIPRLERYIIYDPEDPSTGFYEEISSLNQHQVIVIVCYNSDADENVNYALKFQHVWGGHSRQRGLKELADSDRLYTVQEDKGFKPWQVVSLAAALGVLPVETPKGRPQSEMRRGSDPSNCSLS